MASSILLSSTDIEVVVVMIGDVWQYGQCVEVAGLERPISGEIAVADRVVYSSSRRVFVPPSNRNFGMVFQSYAIWPHMNVFQNAAFPLEVRGLGKREIRDKVMRVLHAVALDEL